MNNINPEEYARIKEQTLGILRRNRYFTLPKVRAYYVTVQVLNDLVKDGLVIDKTSYELGPYFAATDRIEETCIARNIEAVNVKVGNNIYVDCNFFANYNERWFEGLCSGSKRIGIVKSKEVKMIANGLLEKITFKKSKEIVEFGLLTVENGKEKSYTLQVEPSKTFQIIRACY